MLDRSGPVTKLLRLAAILICSSVLQVSLAATYYVDGSSTGCGGSPCSDSNDGLSETSAFATPQGCIDNMAGGDTCLIKNGTYVAFDRGNNKVSWNFCVNGTEESYTEVKNYPGHSPVLCSESGCGTQTSDPPLGVQGSSCRFVRFEGLVIDGGLGVLDGADYVEIAYNEFKTGSFDCDGNRAMILFGSGVFSEGNWIHHNYFHDGVKGGCGDKIAAISFFEVQDTIVEFNTIEESKEGPSIGFRDKDSTTRNVFRYNHFIGVSGKIAFVNNQGDGSNFEFYGNVADSGSDIFDGLIKVDGANIHHNTISGEFSFLGNDSSEGWKSVTVKDNIVYGVTRNVSINEGPWDNISGWNLDYNVYDADGDYRGDRYGAGDQKHTTLASWREHLQSSGCSNCENNSQERDCVFVAGSDTNYHIQAGDPCKTAASDGGEVGAYGVTDCVGHTCGTDPACGDGRDNDGDGLIDLNDLGCASPTDTSELGTTACDNGIDDDGDGLADAAADPGCSGPSDESELGTTACDNGTDDDGDGQTDAADDPGCTGPSDTSELGSAACDDGADNDGDGLVDLADSDCFGPEDNNEGADAASDCSNPAPEWLLCDGFEDGTLDYWSDDQDTQGDKLHIDTDDPYAGSYISRMEHTAGQKSDAWGMHFFGDHSLLDSPGQQITELYVRLYVRYSEANTGGKITITAAFEAWGAGYPGPNSWSPYYVTLYVHPNSHQFQMEKNSKTSGQEVWRQFPQNLGLPVQPQGGQWYEIQYHLVLNTPGQSDGVVEYWIDGAKKAEYFDVNFRDSYSEAGWNDLMIAAHRSNVPTTYSQDLDNIVGSMQFISSRSSGGSVPSVNGLHRTDVKD